MYTFGSKFGSFIVRFFMALLCPIPFIYVATNSIVERSTRHMEENRREYNRTVFTALFAMAIPFLLSVMLLCLSMTDALKGDRYNWFTLIFFPSVVCVLCFCIIWAPSLDLWVMMDVQKKYKALKGLTGSEQEGNFLQVMVNMHRNTDFDYEVWVDFIHRRIRYARRCGLCDKDSSDIAALTRAAGGNLYRK